MRLVNYSKLLFLSVSKNKPWRTKVLSRNLQIMSSNSPSGAGSSDGDDDPLFPLPAALACLGARVPDLDVDNVREYLARKLGLHDHSDNAVTADQVLDEVSVDGIVRWIQGTRCKNIITLAGAGISTSAGIPDFRSPDTGLYHNLAKYNLPEPQAIFEINFFRQNPKPFFTLAKELWPGNFIPTVSHYFIRLLHEKGLLLRHYTQNIDTLERGAGLPEDRLVEAHGTFYTSHCLDCRKEYSMEWMKELVFADQVPRCGCGGLVKPDIVFFGESLPARFQECLQVDFERCDMLIIMGSSLEVQPFASLIDMVPDWCPRLLINREKAGTRSPIFRLLGLHSGGLQLDEDSYRDVALLGNCDDGCTTLATKLGWGDALRELVVREQARLKAAGGNTAFGPAHSSTASSHSLHMSGPSIPLMSHNAPHAGHSAPHAGHSAPVGATPTVVSPTSTPSVASDEDLPTHK
ncbi:NAD-dependent protein deacetylase sirtuin-2 [Plutella xylostella]|uniref:NAD-dependent protein deacetylase sirtuin-2 n=1 Tax=Plutella xylostella TaxID=51655 RepID=UPI0020331AD9|nr:NAD-dependent protein deacetylase sirtuin-2 [Plutella xylostella]